MIPQHIPPPPLPTEPAKIQVIDDNHQQRLESPFQNKINNFNPDGPAPTISLEQAKDVQPDRGQQMQELNDCVQGIGEGAAALAEAKNNADRKKDEESAITGNKDVAAGSTPDKDNSYDYYNGIGQ